ncbi:MAG: nucleotidyltransferase domain-containing protein [Clostridia bacterium]|nr:nucleotidyltransferase domain-containing protein [Clostridia bacterium]
MKYGLSEEIYIKIKNIEDKYSKYQFKIFGSRARGDYKKNSDIDIAIFGNIKDEDEYKILNEFDLLDIPYTFDIVFVEKITKKEFINSILREGVVL